MKFVKRLLLGLLSGAFVLSMAGCGGGNVPAGFERIQFRGTVDEYTSAYFTELCDIYNRTQGQEDKVYVQFMPAADNYLTSLATLLSGRKSSAQVLMVNDRNFKNYAVQNRFVNLDSLLAEENVLTVGENGEPMLDIGALPGGLVDRYRVDTETRETGAGTDLYGVPFGDNPQVFYYNADYLEEIDVNIISVDEEGLDDYNQANGTSLQPHGYAEYLENPMPEASPALTASVNFAGETVYKVFNDRIPMNWEEMIFLAKYLTPEYTKANGKVPAAPSAVSYGLVTEWWFFMCWSVGGDCVGLDPTTGKYKFTLGDTSDNYLVTKPVTVNGAEYAAGDILRYRDKIYVNEHKSDFSEEIADQTLYVLPSTYDAFEEFCALSMPTGEMISSTKEGYGVSPNPANMGQNSYKAYFTEGRVAFANLNFSEANSINSTKIGEFGFCPTPQYREYEGGSLDADGNLKVIGKDGYTGALAEANGVAVQGKAVTGSITNALVIPVNSGGQEEFVAAAKFIQWAAGPEGQAIIAKSGALIPNQQELALSDEFTQHHPNSKLNNVIVASRLTETAEQGDWSYLEDGEWVQIWANVLNGEVRNATKTLEEFFDEVQEITDNALASDKYKITITTK